MDNNKIKVSLSSTDMEILGVSYEELDYEQEDTRLAINDILEHVRDIWGFESSGYKLYVEVFKAEDGGCVFYFTRMKRNSVPDVTYGKNKPRTKSVIPAVLEFSSLEDLCSYCRYITSNGNQTIFSSSLYKMNDNFYLVVFIFKLQYNKIALTAHEFSANIFSGSLYFAHLNEHGKSLLDQQAIENMVNI